MKLGTMGMKERGRELSAEIKWVVERVILDELMT